MAAAPVTSGRLQTSGGCGRGGNTHALRPLTIPAWRSTLWILRVERSTSSLEPTSFSTACGKEAHARARGISTPPLLEQPPERQAKTQQKQLVRALAGGALGRQLRRCAGAVCAAPDPPGQCRPCT